MSRSVLIEHGLRDKFRLLHAWIYPYEQILPAEIRPFCWTNHDRPCVGRYDSSSMETTALEACRRPARGSRPQLRQQLERAGNVRIVESLKRSSRRGVESFSAAGAQC